MTPEETAQLKGHDVEKFVELVTGRKADAWRRGRLSVQESLHAGARKQAEQGHIGAIRFLYELLRAEQQEKTETPAPLKLHEADDQTFAEQMRRTSEAG